MERKRKRRKKRSKKAKQEKRIVEAPRKRLILPPLGLAKPASPFERRMADLSFPIPREGTAEARQLQKVMDSDAAFQSYLKNMQKRLPYAVDARMKGGSGLQLSKLLREFFLEYLDRFYKHGPESFPTSFNVVESFLSFNREFMFFDLREEIEHILSLNDYFRWYETGELPEEPLILRDVLVEGMVYSFETGSNEDAFRVCAESQQVIAGISFVRHEDELSCLMLAGENPPLHSDEEVTAKQKIDVAPGRERLIPDPTLTTQDRYLCGYKDFAKVVVLTRFDIRAGTHDVRYVNLDNGQSFTVFTDDLSVFDDLPPRKAEEYRQRSAEGLTRYDDLFAALSSMIYLPAFLAANPDKVHEVDVSTELCTTQEDREVREAIKRVGESKYITSRVIRCLPIADQQDDKLERKIQPPKMAFKSDGYWMVIGPNEFGENKKGNPVIGRTWVSRKETWSARSPREFLLQRSRSDATGSCVISLDNESKERVLVGEVIMTVALAGQLTREFSVSDHGIDMEIEFKSNEGEATGKKLYLQLKSGDSHLNRRQRDDVEVFQIKDERHARYWMAQQFPVLLVIRSSDGVIRWMEVRDWLKRATDDGEKPVTQIIFEGAQFDVESIRHWRQIALSQ